MIIVLRKVAEIGKKGRQTLREQCGWWMLLYDRCSPGSDTEVPLNMPRHDHQHFRPRCTLIFRILRLASHLWTAKNSVDGTVNHQLTNFWQLSSNQLYVNCSKRFVRSSSQQQQGGSSSSFEIRNAVLEFDIVTKVEEVQLDNPTAVSQTSPEDQEHWESGLRTMIASTFVGR